MKIKKTDAGVVSSGVFYAEQQTAALIAALKLNYLKSISFWEELQQSGTQLVRWKRVLHSIIPVKLSLPEKRAKDTRKEDCYNCSDHPTMILLQ